MAEQLKNVYSKNYIQNLALKIKEIYKEFDERKFINKVFDSSWENLELKARMRHIALNLNACINLSYEKQIEVLKEVSKSFTSFDAMFFQDFVEVFGLEYFDISIKALEVFTQESSSEFAIRAFILKYEDKTLAKMLEWTQSSNEHLRRLSCEGCRPRLPWAIALPKFKKDPAKILEIINLLKYDEAKYVQKSLANNLNDISKDNPEILIQFVKNNLGKNTNLDWVCKHASRTLLKKGDETALLLFGYKQSSHVDVINFEYDRKTNLGENLNFSFSLKSEASLGKLRIEYAIYYKKANGSNSKKVFMIAQNDFNQKEKSFIKKQSFKNMTTRKHYEGEHFISIIINGNEYEKRSFILNDTGN